MSSLGNIFHPVRQGNWSNLKVVVFGTPGAEAAKTANRIEVPLTTETDDGQTVAEQVVFAVRVSDTDMGPASTTAKIYPADTVVGNFLEGSGTASARVQTNSSGAMTISVEETAGSSGTPARRYLTITATYGSKSYLRSSANSLTLSFT